MVPETYQAVEQGGGSGYARPVPDARSREPDARKPPWALAVAESAPTGADRQGRGRS
jgi:hypothetical protein